LRSSPIAALSKSAYLDDHFSVSQSINNASRYIFTQDLFSASSTFAWLGIPAKY